MHLDYIVDMKRVAELQSINKAARYLNISTPALSKRIKCIEDYFECKLFYRSAKGIYLTEAGEIVVRKLNDIHKEIHNLKRDINKDTSSKLRIGVLPSYFLYQIEKNSSPLLDEGLTINVESTTQILLSRLHEAKVDAMIGDLESVKSNNLICKTLYSEGYNLIYSRSLFEALKSEIRIEKIEGATLFVLNPPCDTLNFIKENFNFNRVNTEYKDNLDSILADVRMGNGYTILPDSLRYKADKLNLDYVKIKSKKRAVGVMSYNEALVKTVSEKLYSSLN